MSQDIRLKVTFPSDVKTLKLEKALGQCAVWCLIKLWCWVADHRPSGILTGIDSEGLEVMADWRGEVGSLAKKLISLRFIDKDEKGGMVVHGWAEHQPWVISWASRVARARVAALARWNRDSNSVPCDPLFNPDDAPSNAPGGTEVDEHGPSNAPSNATFSPDDDSETMEAGHSSGKKREKSSTCPYPTQPNPTQPIPSISSKVVSKPQELGSSGVSGKRASIPGGLLQGIIREYHRILPMLPQVKAAGKVLLEKLACRVRDDEARMHLGWWTAFFTDVGKSGFLTGEGSRGWRASLLWLCGPENIEKVLGGQYVRNGGKDGVLSWLKQEAEKMAEEDGER